MNVIMQARFSPAARRDLRCLLPPIKLNRSFFGGHCRYFAVVFLHGLLPICPIEVHHINFRRLGRTIFCPVNTVNCYRDPVRIGPWLIPRHYTTHFTKSSSGGLCAPFIKYCCVFQRFFHRDLKGRNGDDDMYILAHVAIGTIAVYSCQVGCVANKTTLNAAAMAASKKNFHFFVILFVGHYSQDLFSKRRNRVCTCL
jgi:hypothetical protein